MRKLAWILCSVASLFLFGCNDPPVTPVRLPDVSIAIPYKQDVPEYVYYSGRTEAKESVDIRARVEGILEKIEFRDGDDVKAGQVLFVIEQEPFETKYAAAQAEMQQAAAREKLAKTEAARSRVLLKSKAISVEEAQQKEAEVAVASAQVAIDEQKVRQAKIELDYTTITSPIPGKVSEKLIDIGNLVGSGESTLLTTVVQMDPINVYFDLAESVFIRMQRRRTARTEEDGDRDLRVEMRLEDEESFSQVGQLDFLENRVDPDTGTILVRGQFPNPTGLLYPGLFVRLRIPLAVSKDALLVKQSAVATDLGGKFVMIVGKDNVVERRYVELGTKYGDMQVAVKGISEDEQYIVKGIQRARPGLPVNPELIEVKPKNVVTEADDSVEAGQPAEEQAPGSTAPADTSPNESDANSEADVKSPQ